MAIDSSVYVSVQYAVLNEQPLPKNIKPIISSMTFIIHIITVCVRNFSVNALIGVINLLKIIERPLTPPVAKLFGALKSTTPRAVSIVPRFKITQYSMVLFVFLRFSSLVKKGFSLRFFIFPFILFCG